MVHVPNGMLFTQPLANYAQAFAYIWNEIPVLLTIRYLCDPRGRRGSEQDLWEAILDAFGAEPRIDFAYPTQRLYANDREGKPETRPEQFFGHETGNSTLSNQDT